jgi:hypothetical protein
MKRFPPEFADLLNRKGQGLLDGRIPTFNASFRSQERWFVSVQDILNRDVSDACVRLLDWKMFPLLKTLTSEVAPETIWEMNENYAESLPKSMLVKSAELNARRSKSIEVAQNIGLMDMLHSESFLRFARVISGFEVERKPARQVLCYLEGHYVGPHNDHHPESEDYARGYIDVQITLANDAVDHQWLIYEKNRHLNGIVSIGVPNMVSVYWLPFWHYTTPLVAKKGREKSARRWLLLGTFDLPAGSPSNPKAVNTRHKPTQRVRRTDRVIRSKARKR